MSKILEGAKEAVAFARGEGPPARITAADGGPYIQGERRSACLIRDLFDVEDGKLYADIRRSLRRIHPSHPACSQEHANPH